MPGRKDEDGNRGVLMGVRALFALALAGASMNAVAAVGDVSITGPMPASVAAGSCFTLSYAVDVGATPLKLAGARLRLIASDPEKVELNGIDVSDSTLPDLGSWSVASIAPPPATATQFDANGRISIQAAASASQLGSGVRRLLSVEVCVKPGAAVGNVQLTLEFRDPLAMLSASNQAVDLAVAPNPVSFAIQVAGPAQATLAVTPASRSVGSVAGSTTFDIATTAAWTASSNQGWATLSAASGAGSGTLTVTCAANPGAAPRTATITLTAPGATGSPKSVTVIQAAAAPTLSVSPESATAPPTGATRTFSVANTGAGTMQWSVSPGCDWVTVSPSSGANGGTVLATIQPNATNQQRSCTLTISAAGATGSPKMFAITQGPAGTLTVTPVSRSVGSTAGSTNFEISAPGAWTAASDEGWATVSPIAGNGNGTLTVSYNANTVGVSRTANITVSAQGAIGTPKSVVVTQAASCPATLAQPLAETRNFTGSRRIEVLWEAVPGATGYRIYRALESADFESASVVAEVPGTTYTDLDVEGGYDGFALEPACGTMPGCGACQQEVARRFLGPGYTYWVQALNSACELEGPVSEPASGNSWKEAKTRAVNADAGVLVIALLALAAATRRLNRRRVRGQAVNRSL